jgi:hypothetical protein
MQDWSLVVQRTASEMSEGKRIRDMPNPHGSLKGGATHFKTIRHRTTRNRFMRTWNPTLHMAGINMLASVPTDGDRPYEWPPGGGHGDPGCQMRHAPPQAGDVPELAAPQHSQYRDSLNNPLTCIVFVPDFLLTVKRYTTRRVGWTKNFG